ncbi:MAG: hypothetical protein KC777_19020 [Cyanobacteria bacterium HKST-UBA02]|nr:hypothetical protein [Cyanobacteria bacterium HKST-UBA02]
MMASSKDYYLGEGEFGTRLIVNRPCSTDLKKVITQSDPKQLVLNSLPESGLEFLRDSGIEHLTVHPGCRFLPDPAPIETLSSLKFLHIGVGIGGTLNLSHLPLKEITAIWSEEVSSILKCRELEELSLGDFSGTDLTSLCSLEKLTSLRIIGGALKDLRGLEKLLKLESLDLGNLRLKKADALLSATALKQLDLHKTGLRDLSSLRNLINLKWLVLNDCGNLESLHPIQSLPELMSIIIMGTTNIVDGDFGCLLSNRNIRSVSFGDRRHYSHTKEEWKAARYSI